MPDLLFELFSEEIPARMQARAADDLRRMVTDRLVAEGLVYERAQARDTPPPHRAGARPSTGAHRRPSPGSPSGARGGAAGARGPAAGAAARARHPRARWSGGGPSPPGKRPRPWNPTTQPS